MIDEAAVGSPWRRTAAIFGRMQMPLPPIIQGGMGVAVSSWPLARAVSLRGQLGVVSGTGIDTVVTRRLQLGDPGGHLRRAFDAFPLRDVSGTAITSRAARRPARRSSRNPCPR
jgi:NAD(P)H-dependent flavin oxidoreductase YrpB (nitropropane dioxygenase family)